MSPGWVDRTGNGFSSVIFRLTLSQLAAIFFLKFPDTVWILLIWFLLFSSGIRPFVEPITEGSFEGFELVPLCFWAFVVWLEAPGTRFGLDSVLLFYDNMIHNIWPIFIIFFIVSKQFLSFYRPTFASLVAQIFVQEFRSRFMFYSCFRNYH